MQTIDLATAVRRRLTDTAGKATLIAAMGWSASDASRILSGQQGIPLEKIDVLVSEIGFVPVGQKYLSAMQTMCVVGSQCECALAGKGACGIN